MDVFTVMIQNIEEAKKLEFGCLCGPKMIFTNVIQKTCLKLNFEP